MGYTLVKSFERGIDTRKLIDTTEPGTLLDARNLHITLGGELEKRAAFVVTDTLPAGTIGLWVTEGRVIHTWGDAPATAPPAGMPAGAVYHSIPDPDASPLVRILSVEEFNSKLYVVAEYADAHVYHWWDDDLVLEPAPTATPGGGTPPATGPTNKPQVTIGFLPSTFGGLPPSPPDVTITGAYLLSPTSTYNFAGPTPDAFMLIPTTGTFPGTGHPMGNIAVPGGFSDPPAVVAAVVNAINSFVTVPKVNAQAAPGGAGFSVGCQVWVDDVGITYNGWKIAIGVTYYVPAITFKYPLSGGVAPPPGVPAPPPGPTPPTVKGDFAIAHNYRMFAVQNTQTAAKLNYSAPRDPSEWDNPDRLTGFIDLSMITNRKPTLVSMADYGANLAIFGKRHIFVYFMDVTPLGDQIRQTIHNTGTFAPHSVVPWGATDVMYLDISGIRSLRARDSSEQAFSADLGNLIDDLVKQKVATLTVDQQEHNVWGVVEPRSGRLWMALYDKIFVLNYYPSSRIAAWTYYDATEAPVDYMVTSDDSVYWRSGDDVLIYGNEAGDEYDDTEALARVPYIDAGKPATAKNWTGIDTAVFGTWAIRGSFDPTLPVALDLLANITKSTYAQQKIAVNGESPALSLEFRSIYVGPARIGNAALHYTDSTAD